MEYLPRIGGGPELREGSSEEASRETRQLVLVLMSHLFMSLVDLQCVTACRYSHALSPDSDILIRSRKNALGSHPGNLHVASLQDMTYGTREHGGACRVRSTVIPSPPRSPPQSSPLRRFTPSSPLVLTPLIALVKSTFWFLGCISSVPVWPFDLAGNLAFFRVRKRTRGYHDLTAQMGHTTRCILAGNHSRLPTARRLFLFTEKMHYNRPLLARHLPLRSLLVLALVRSLSLNRVVIYQSTSQERVGKAMYRFEVG